ncbi:MAG: UDP-N-acetylenolpyruvoylglucosamine reductase [Candidatus Dichloromethanomonas elyunquensis]|nr:MAG: UDP-N-acetylenolpyruvoylglucosamine reductase [Candidatus Dichloromethanomonas elyunquensis]
MDLPKVKGKLEKDYPLKTLNTWKTGGRAEMVFWPQNMNELTEMVIWSKIQHKPLLFLGHGSNVLLPDKGFPGTVIVTTQLNGARWENEQVWTEAGYSLMRLAREAAERNCSGLEFACGIPGTVGAAIAINAGAYGKEIGELVRNVKVLTSEGEIKTLDRKEISFRYRKSSLQENNWIILESSLRLTAAEDGTAIKAKMKEFMAKRKETQPLEYPNAGSVFRNPQGDSAGRLIEQAGWKGKCVGDAQVSEKHANFIVNRGNAKSENILQLIQDIQADILMKYGVKLETEIRMITG